MNLPQHSQLFTCAVLIIIILFLPACKDEITSPPEKPIYTSEIKGKVLLGNQTEHSNALVYLDSLHRGVGTDSSGSYSILFTSEDSIYNGVFKLYFFVHEFEMDSAQYVLVNGKVKLDSLDVDGEGNLPTKELEQLVLIEGWTDREEYRAGNTITFTGQFTNVTDRTVYIFISDCGGPFSPPVLYNENYPPFALRPCISVPADCGIFLEPNGFYRGNLTYVIPDSYYCSAIGGPLITEEYVVATSLYIENRLIDFRKNKLYNFARIEWYNLHRGKTPKLDVYPNKYKYPIIRIIE